MSEDVDFDFFDSPRTKTGDEDARNAALSSAKNRASSRSTSTATDDASSERTVTSAKPPTHPKSRRVRRSDGDNDTDPADSPRSNTSASTNHSRRTINAKIPSVVNDDDDDDRSDNNSDSDDDNSNMARSEDRSSHRSGKDDRSRRSSSVASSSDRRKKDRKEAGSNRSSVLSQEERRSGSQSIKKGNKKSLYLSDDSDTDDQSSDVSDTDSDVTKVSPLNSPHETLKSKKSLIRTKSAGKSRAARDARNGPDNNSTMNFNQILNAHKDTLDLKVLLQTVLEMENDRSTIKNRDSRSRSDMAPGGDFCRQRRNYSFNNDQVKKIDKENQRLMEIILRNAREAQKKKKEIKMAGMNPRTTTWLRPTSSAINRVRQQQKIEAENMGILRRLQQTQPTRELQRDTQIKEYQRQLVFAGCAPLSSIQPRPKPYIPPSAKNGFATGDYQSDYSFQSGTGKLRPHSAFVSRPLSGKQTANASVKKRPKSAITKKETTKKETVKDLQLDDYVEDFEA